RAGETIAAGDVGAVGYYCDAFIYDLGGLVWAERWQYADHLHVVEAKKPAYIFAETPSYWSEIFDPGSHLRGLYAPDQRFAPSAGSPPSPPGADAYGGVARGVSSPSGHFAVKQVGDRWMFITPEGNGMWMLGVFAVIYSTSVDDLGSSGQSRIAARYGSESAWQDRWRQFTVKRLKAWGFNTLAEYHHWTLRAGPQPGANPERIPFIHIIKPAYYGLTNSGNFGNGAFKDLIQGTDERYYTGYRGSHAPDFFDPAFEAYVDGWMRKDDGLAGQIGNPWMLGISMDDADNLFGFGPGAELPAARLHPHLGWIVLVTNFA